MDTLHQRPELNSIEIEWACVKRSRARRHLKIKQS